MLKTLLLILFLGCFSTSFAASKFIDGEGRFYAQDDDSLSFVKMQLRYSAFKDVLTKELEQLGLDATTFWSKYEEKFEAYFEPIKENLKKNHGLDGTKKLSRADRRKYEMELRAKRLRLKASYGRLDRIITSFTVKKYSRSTNDPKARYLRVQAKVDRRALNQLFLKFTANGDDRIFQKIYLTTEFEIEDGIWNDLGVEIESDFSNVVKDHWNQWLTENMKGFVKEVDSASESVLSNLRDYLKIPVETTEKIYIAAAGEVESDDTDSPVNGEFRDSLWLNIQVTIKKTSENLLMKRRSFEINGEYILIDLNTKNLVTHGDFLPERKRYSFEDPHKLSSSLASLVWSLPIEYFKTFNKEIASLPTRVRRVNLDIENVDSILDLFHLNELLASRGLTKQFNPRIRTYTGKKATVLLEYQGSPSGLVETLLSLNNEKISEEKVISLKSNERPFSMKVEKASTAGKAKENKVKNKKMEKSQG